MIPNFQIPDESDLQSVLRMEPEILNPTSVVIHLSGYIDTYNSQFFAKQMSAVTAAGYTRIVLGCARLTYISSTGVGAFTSILKEAGATGKVILAEPSTKILEVFQLLGFASFFTVTDTMAEAKSLITGQVSTPKSVESGVFPKAIACPICSKKLKVSKPGSFRCPECKSGLIVDETGNMTLK